jgi:hypothetical protein
LLVDVVGAVQRQHGVVAALEAVPGGSAAGARRVAEAEQFEGAYIGESDKGLYLACSGEDSLLFIP